MAQDLVGHAPRMKRIQRIQLLAGAHEFDRAPVTSIKLIRRAAARIAVHLRQDHARQRQIVVELLRRVHAS